MIKKALSAVFFVILLTRTAMAYGTDYTLSGTDRIPAPESYIYSYSINRLSGAPLAGSTDPAEHYLNQPSDLFIDSRDFLFVADTKNNRVVKTTRSGELLKVYDTAGGVPFNNPQGVYVTDNGDVYIADTGNSRIVHLSEAGELMKTYEKPESPYLSDIEVYSPTRIAASRNGGLYVLMGQNIMDVDASNRFRGYLGQAKIGYSFTDRILRAVASEEQKKNIMKRLASSYTNFTVGGDNFIYAVSQDTAEGQIKILNSVGNNIYRKAGSAAGEEGVFDIIGDFFTANILKKPFRYGEIIDGNQPDFSDICVDRRGIVTVVEQQYGRLYQYDRTGNLLIAFGGLGTNQGEFAIPVSLAVDSGGLLYVLDSSLGNIQVFKPTEFIQMVQSAATAYNDGDYALAEKLWNDVLAADETYPLAHHGLANVDYKKGNWKAAMEGFQYSNDRVEYSKAFAELRHDSMKANFGLLTAAVLLISAAAVFLLIWSFRKSRACIHRFEYDKGAKMTLGSALWLGIGMIYRPGRTMDSIKSERGRLKPYAAVIVLLLVFAARLFFIYTVHYPLQDIELTEANLVLELFKNIVPLLTWIAACYLISSQFSGESTLIQNFICMCYSMAPYVVITTVSAMLSQVMCAQDNDIFGVLIGGSAVWTLWLLVKSVKRLNDYGTGHTVGVCLTALIAVVLIWFVVLFGYTLSVRLVQFIQEVAGEIQMALL